MKIYIKTESDNEFVLLENVVENPYRESLLTQCNKIKNATKVLKIIPSYNIINNDYKIIDYIFENLCNEKNFIIKHKYDNGVEIEYEGFAYGEINTNMKSFNMTISGKIKINGQII